MSVLVTNKAPDFIAPAGWNRCDDGTKPSTNGVADYLASHVDKL